MCKVDRVCKLKLWLSVKLLQVFRLWFLVLEYTHIFVCLFCCRESVFYYYVYNSELDPKGYHFHLGDHYYNPCSYGHAPLTGFCFMVLVPGLSVTWATKCSSCSLLSTEDRHYWTCPVVLLPCIFMIFPTFPNLFCAIIIDYTKFAHLFIEHIFFLIFLQNWKLKPKHHACCLVNAWLLFPRW